MVIQYKCPDCGSEMLYSSDTGMLTCVSCDKTINIEEYPQFDQSTNASFQEYANTTSYQTYNEDEAKQYQCSSCGAILITDNDTTATICSFCGSSIVLSDRLSGKLAPTKVIPFKISKTQAQEAFKKWCKKGLLTPKGFMSANRIKSITGIYVPFWLYDLNAQAETNATCTKVRCYSDGEYDVTETSYFDVYRKATIDYDQLPCDASSKMEDGLMDKLEPFNYNELKVFKMPYLSGFIAEKYNYDDKELFPRAQKRTEYYASDYLRNTIHGYASVTMHHQNIHVQQKNADYTLLPVWMVSYDYQNKEYIFAMNGQTGKVVGKPPISKSKIATWFLGISLLCFILLRIMTYIVGGV